MKTRLLIMMLGISSVITISIFAVMWFEYGMICNNAVVEHLQKYSNLFADDYDGEFAMHEVGHSFGVHALNIQECVDFVFEKRIKELENEN